MKLFERLRWLPTDRPPPGTADVSANSCVLPTLVGDTPGTSSARSRKLRPFIGRLCTSACEIVPAIWLRAASSTVASPVTVTLRVEPATASVIGSSKADPIVSVSGAVDVGEAVEVHRDLVAARPSDTGTGSVHPDRSRSRARRSCRRRAR